MSATDDRFLGRPEGRLMLLGTFHFQPRHLDRHKSQFTPDVLSDEYQVGIAEVADRLASFQPTKVAIERTADQQAEIDREYGAYLRDEFTLPADEVYQLGFRLAKRLGHSGVHCVNAWDRHYEPQVDVEAYAREHGQKHLLTQWWPRFERWYEHLDRLMTQITLRELLLGFNSEEAVLKNHGPSMVDWFRVGVGDDYPGVDRVTGWDNRNLRIFANIQRITESPDERILLVIGAGHLPILRHCALASPEYELVELHDYLQPRDAG